MKNTEKYIWVITCVKILYKDFVSVERDYPLLGFSLQILIKLHIMLEKLLLRYLNSYLNFYFSYYKPYLNSYV